MTTMIMSSRIGMTFVVSMGTSVMEQSGDGHRWTQGGAIYYTSAITIGIMLMPMGNVKAYIGTV